MRRLIRRALIPGALAGTLVLAVTPVASAAPATQSPEGIGIAASGTLVTVSPTPDATSSNPNPASVVSVTVDSVLTAHTLNAAVSGNTTTASVQSLDESGILTPLLGTISAGVISSTCTANSDGTFTESASVANLSILGATFNGTPGKNTSLSLTLPSGILSASVTLNEQVAGPVAGSQTVNAVHIHFTTALVSEDIYIASSTCGPFSQTVPLASGSALTVGLGAVGVLGLGYGAVYWHRRRLVSQA